MKRLVSLAVMGATALGSIGGGSKCGSYCPEQLLSDGPEHRSRCGEVVVGGFIPTRGAAAYQIAGDTLDIGPIMDIGPTGGITLAAGTIHIGVTEIGMGTDAESETKPYKKRNSRLTIPL
jgi:hypothetical protein